MNKTDKIVVVAKTKSGKVRRKPCGKILSYYGEMVTCPVCSKTRFMQTSNYRRSVKKYSVNPEIAGICIKCRLKLLKPAKKGYKVLLFPVEQ